MKEIVLKLSDEDVMKIEKQIIFDGHLRNLDIKIVEICFTESPVKLDYIKGRLK